MADCQCSKCPFHGVKDQENRFKADNKSFTSRTTPPLANNNHIHNHCSPHHIIPPPPAPHHFSLEGLPQDLHGFRLDSSLRYPLDVDHRGCYNNLDGWGENDEDDDVNSLSDCNSDYENEDDDEDDDDDDDDDGSSCSHRRISQSSGIVDVDNRDLKET